MRGWIRCTYLFLEEVVSKDFAIEQGTKEEKKKRKQEQKKQIRKRREEAEKNRKQ